MIYTYNIVYLKKHNGKIFISITIYLVNTKKKKNPTQVLLSEHNIG